MIHPSAFISKSAEIAEDVEVHPYVYIGEGVKIGRGTKILFGAYIEFAEIGEENIIYPYAIIGAPPQHMEYKGERTKVKIGNRNIIREFVTIHRGTMKGGGETIIGDENYFMAYSHVGHDVKIGNSNIFTNYVGIAGHVEIEDFVVFGGSSGAHQFVRIGELSMIGAATFVNQDVLPFSLVSGVNAKIFGINVVGLRRRGVPGEEIEKIKNAFKIILSPKLLLEEAINKIKNDDELNNSIYIKKILNFLEKSQKSPRKLLRKAEWNE